MIKNQELFEAFVGLFMTIQDLIYRIISQVLSPIVFLLFSIALIVFLWGIVYYVVGAQGSDQKLKQGKLAMFWGIVGMSVMFSAWGLVRLVCNTFGTCEGIGIIDSLFPGGGGGGGGGGSGSGGRRLEQIPRTTPRPGGAGQLNPENPEFTDPSRFNQPRF